MGVDNLGWEDPKSCWIGRWTACGTSGNYISKPMRRNGDTSHSSRDQFPCARVDLRSPSQCDDVKSRRSSPAARVTQSASWPSTVIRTADRALLARKSLRRRNRSARCCGALEHDDYREGADTSAIRLVTWWKWRTRYQRWVIRLRGTCIADSEISCQAYISSCTALQDIYCPWRWRDKRLKHADVACLRKQVPRTKLPVLHAAPQTSLFITPSFQFQTNFTAIEKHAKATPE